MKKITVFALLLLIVLVSVTSCAGNSKLSLAPLNADRQSPTGSAIINPDSEVRGVWIASVFNIDFPSYSGLSEAKLKGEIDAIIDTCKKAGLNTIFFQVRPSCDALYESDIFPVSSFLSTDGELTFDVLEYFVEEAHKNNIFLHAWINPLRVTVAADSEGKLPETSPAKEHPEWTVKYADGKLYLNAGIPEVRTLVADGVREIVENYDVDGIVFDDYFYPYPSGDAEFDDKATFEKYGAGFDSIADWRRDNINQMVKLCYETVKSVYDECLFGVSPGGVWQNNNGENGGSDTTGFETYHSLYCDSLAWIEGGYIDYISPQIYWQFETAGTPYDTLIDWWNTVLDGSGVHLWVSHGAYRYEDGDWSAPSGEMSNQIKYAREALSYRGSVFYGYDEIKGNDFGISDELTESYTDSIIYCNPASSGEGVSITSHYYGQECTAGKVIISGTSDPSLPLTCNGNNVNRHKNGSFSFEAYVSRGENVFTFSQGEESFSLVIHGK